MSLSLKQKPVGSTSVAEHDISVLQPNNTQPLINKTRAANVASANGVSSAELWAARIGFFTGGFTVASWAPLIPFVQSGLSLTPMILGVLLLGLGVGSFVGMPLAGSLAKKMGCRNAIAASGLISCALLVLLAWMPNYYFECIALFLYGISLGCLEVSANIYGTHLEKRNGTRLMSGMHAAYSIGEVFAAGCITALLVLGVTPFTTISLLMAALSATIIAVLRNVRNEKIQKSNDKKDSGSFQLAFKGPVLLLAFVCAAVFLAEGAMLDWSAIYLRDEGGVAQEMSPIGYTLFVIAMAASRLLGDKLIMKRGAQFVLTVGLGLMISTLVLMVLYPQPWVLFASLFVMGLGIANLAPIIISAASRDKGEDSVTAITTVSTIGYGGLLAGPAIIGAISSSILLPGAFLFIVALLTLSVFMVRRHATIFN